MLFGPEPFAYSSVVNEDQSCPDFLLVGYRLDHPERERKDWSGTAAVSDDCFLSTLRTTELDVQVVVFEEVLVKRSPTGWRKHPVGSELPVFNCHQVLASYCAREDLACQEEVLSMSIAISPWTAGVIACVFLAVFWLLFGRKDTSSVVIFVVGCVVILAVTANWTVISPLIYHSSSHPVRSHASNVHPVPTTHVTVVPTRAPVQRHDPSPTVQSVNKQQVKTQPAQPVASPILSSLWQIWQGVIALIVFVAAVLLVGVGFVIANKAVMRSYRGTSGRCPQCGQQGSVQEVTWREGKLMHRRTMCSDCANRQREAAVAS